MFEGRQSDDGSISDCERLIPASKEDWNERVAGLSASRKKRVDLVGTQNLKTRSARGKIGRSYRQRQDVLKLKAYAHDRIVVNAYTAPPLVHVRRMSRASLAKRAAGYALELKRETQHGFKIGGKWRFVPTDSSFTHRAKNTIRDAAHIEESEGSGVAVFLTLTVPGSQEAAFKVMSAGSGYAVNRFNQRLREICNDGMFCYAWELQERGAPHLHYLFRLPKPVHIETFRQRFRDIWFAVLLDIARDTGVDVAARKSGQSWFHNKNMWQVDLRTVRQDYSRYMSKYLSKTASKSGAGFTWRPGRWVGVSYPLRERVRLRRLELAIPVRSLRCGFEIAKTLANVLRDFAKNVKWCGGEKGMAPRCLSIQAASRGALDLTRAIFNFVAFGDCSGFTEYIRVFEPLLANSS